MRAFVVNLDRETKRWKFIEDVFARTRLELVRVPAVDGRALTLPIPEFSEPHFRRIHGRPTNLGEIGCYLSHIRACRAFLETGDEYGMICEDDIRLETGCEAAVQATLEQGRHWDVVRLSGLRPPPGVRALGLPGGYRLAVVFGRQKGTGAYLVSRAGARMVAEQLIPMKVPFDHAVDREWFYGLRSYAVLPYPVSQKEGFKSSIQTGGGVEKLGSLQRLLTTYPYQVFNEGTRLVSRAWQLGGLLARSGRY